MDAEGDVQHSFKTGLTDPHANRMELAMGLGTDPELEIIPLRKLEDGIFQDKIGVGRTRNNDIVIPYARVSKFHAYFTWNEDRSEFYLTDPGSTNGTFLNGVRLSPNGAKAVPNRTIVSFGRFHFRFQTARGLYDLLGEIAFGG